MRIHEGGDEGDGKCERAVTGKEVCVWLSEGRGSGFDAVVESAESCRGED